MHWKRVRDDIATLAEGAYSSVLQWALSTRSQRRTSASAEGDPLDADAENRDATAPENDIPQAVFERLVQRMMDGKAPELDWIAKWVEAHGEDASLAFMAQWERVSREIVDEMMSDRHEGRRRKSKRTRAVLNRWERAAEAISEGIVNVMMDSSDSAKRRKRRKTERNDP